MEPPPPLRRPPPPVKKTSNNNSSSKNSNMMNSDSRNGSSSPTNSAGSNGSGGSGGGNHKRNGTGGNGVGGFFSSSTSSSSARKNNNRGTSGMESGGDGGGSASDVRKLAGRWAQSAARSVRQWTVRRYALPDKNVASQVLMYRQLLHTKCRPGLRLTREYQGTAAQVAVKDMPWWCQGDMEQTRAMVISYDNLVTRLWLHGAVYPYRERREQKRQQQQQQQRMAAAAADGSFGDTAAAAAATAAAMTGHHHREEDGGGGDDDILHDTLCDPDTGNPPIPHEHWIKRLGFQQRDPVTDFRSGGVLSLAMMVYLSESCPAVYSRFVAPAGDAAVLPFALTCINVTDMMAKFLMLSRAVDRMDALLSQKPFWMMFGDPTAMLACHELAMSMLADVVVELRQERAAAAAGQQQHDGDVDGSNASSQQQPDLVTVFDFAWILQKTERRVEHDLLGAGPTSVSELRQIHAKIRSRYRQQLNARLRKSATAGGGGAAAAVSSSTADGGTNDSSGNGSGNGNSRTRRTTTAGSELFRHASSGAGQLAGTAGQLAGAVVSKIKKGGGGGGGGGAATAAAAASGNAVASTSAAASVPRPTVVSIPPLQQQQQQQQHDAEAAAAAGAGAAARKEEKKDDDEVVVDSRHDQQQHGNWSHANKGDDDGKPEDDLKQQRSMDSLEL